MATYFKRKYNGRVLRMKILIFLILIRLKGTIRVRNFLRTSDLVLPLLNTWEQLYKYGNDSSLINVTSLNRLGFENLLRKFKQHFLVRGLPGLPGRRYKLETHAILALVLVFYTDCMGQRTLCQMFGIPPGTLCRYLKKAEDALFMSLLDEPLAQICWPSLEQQHMWGLAVQSKEHLVTGRWGFIDGKNYPVQTPTNAELQNAYYNGWLHCVFVTGTLCFGADGCIAWGKHNFAGSWNDGEMSRSFQHKLLREDINLPHHGVLADTAFPVANQLMGKIITPLKDGDLERAPPDTRPALLLLSSAITSLRQACEWGMGAVEKVYRRLLIPLPFDKDKRNIRLLNIHRLYNYRVRTTGISQIKNYFGV